MTSCWPGAGEAELNGTRGREALQRGPGCPRALGKRSRGALGSVWVGAAGSSSAPGAPSRGRAPQRSPRGRQRAGIIRRMSQPGRSAARRLRRRPYRCSGGREISQGFQENSSNTGCGCASAMPRHPRGPRGPHQEGAGEAGSEAAPKSRGHCTGPRAPHACPERGRRRGQRCHPASLRPRRPQSPRPPPPGVEQQGKQESGGRSSSWFYLS